MITNISMAAHSATCAAAKRRLIGSECSFADYLRSPHHDAATATLIRRLR